MIKDKIQKKLGKAFDTKLADAVYSFVCSKTIQQGEFDWETQTYSDTTVIAYSGRGVLFGSYLKDLVKPADYQADDCKAIILQNEVSKQFPEYGIEINDTWSTDKGFFKVVNFGFDPASCIWTVQLRKTVATVFGNFPQNTTYPSDQFQPYG